MKEKKASLRVSPGLGSFEYLPAGGGFLCTVQFKLNPVETLSFDFRPRGTPIISHHPAECCLLLSLKRMLRLSAHSRVPGLSTASLSVPVHSQFCGWQSLGAAEVLEHSEDPK